MEIWLSIMVFVLGICFGSFANMLVYRTAVDYELIKSKNLKKKRNVNLFKMLGGRSFCDYCGKQLSWYENIPVISWIMQKGKTRCCQKNLPVLYPIVEIMTGLLFLLLFRSQISDLRSQILLLFLGLVIITFLVFSTVFDLKYMILPDFSTVILIGCSVVLILVGAINEFPLHLGLAAIGASGFLGLLYLITKGKGMGLGDVKLAVFMGLFLGGEKTILAFYIAFITGAMVSLALMIFRKANKKSLIAFGPFLILGTFVSWFIGDNIIEFLISNFW